MAAGDRERRRQAATYIGLGLMLVCLKWAFLVATVGFGMESGESRFGQVSQQGIEHLNRAVNVAFTLSLLTGLGAIVLIFRGALRLLPPLHWSIQSLVFLAVVVATVLCSSGGTWLTFKFGGSSFLLGVLPGILYEVVSRVTP